MPPDKIIPIYIISFYTICQVNLRNEFRKFHIILAFNTIILTKQIIKFKIKCYNILKVVISVRFDNVNPGEHPEYIIVGLGNPGQRYERTRHNIGFDVADYLDSVCANSRGIKRMLHSSLCDKCVLDGYIVYIVKPQTFMNNSGMSVKDVMSYYRMRPSQLIVIHDDTKIKLGEFKIKTGGSASGHNGIKSIIEHLRTDNFIRIRVGVGEKPEQFDMSKYVLSRLTDNEYKSIQSQFNRIKIAISCIFNYGIDRAIEFYNE